MKIVLTLPRAFILVGLRFLEKNSNSIKICCWKREKKGEARKRKSSKSVKFVVREISHLEVALESPHRCVIENIPRGLPSIEHKKREKS